MTMSKYTINYICTDKYGHSVVKSEEHLNNTINEAIEIVKSKWVNWQVKILWAGILKTDGWPG